MRVEAVGLGLLVAALALFLAGIPFPVLIIVHWFAALAGFAVLSRVPRLRASAVASAGFVLLLLLAGIAAGALSVGPFGAGGASGDDVAIATTLLGGAGVLALAFFGATAYPGAPRLVGALSLLAAFAGLAGVPLDLSDGIVGMLLLLAVLAGIGAFALYAPRLVQGPAA